MPSFHFGFTVFTLASANMVEAPDDHPLERLVESVLADLAEAQHLHNAYPALHFFHPHAVVD